MSKPKPKLTGGTPRIDFIFFYHRNCGLCDRCNGIVFYSPDPVRQDITKILLSHGILSSGWVCDEEE